MPAPTKRQPPVPFLARMSPEAKRKLKDAFDKHPEWTDVDGARRVNAFRRAARALVLGKDRGIDDEASTREQVAALLLCDRIADIFDPLLGGPHAGVNQDDLWRIVAPMFVDGAPKEDNIEERRARAVVVVDEWAVRYSEAGDAHDSMTRGMIAILAQAAHPAFDCLANRLSFVEEELRKFKPGTKRGRTPGRGKRTSAGILARLCVESGAFIEGGEAATYQPPKKKEDYDILVTEQYDAIRKAVEREFARWAHLKDRT